MKKRSIYQNRSQELLSLFEKAGSSAKVMCVPMDFAKKDHLVMFCNGYGDILRKPFSVKNSPERMTYLIDQASRFCRKRGIKKQHVFFGGEDVNSYAENFVSTLRSKGWLVAGVNAHDAKKQRANLQASTDRLDLMGIATMLLNCRANCCPAQSGTYRNLRTVVRHRRKLVAMSTEVKNRIYGIVERLDDSPARFSHQVKELTKFHCCDRIRAQKPLHDRKTFTLAGVVKPVHLRKILSQQIVSDSHFKPVLFSFQPSS